MSYSDFIAHKLTVIQPSGIASNQDLSGYVLMPHQDDLVRWALRRGRCAIFADTGLGKTRMQLAWADRIHKETGSDVLILAPLAVAEQTVGEGRSIGVKVTHCREASDVSSGINITNYDRLHKFDTSRFGAVVLDESSCIKHHDTKTLAKLLAAFSDTAYKLCATATPAPNDWTELGTHAEFLGICTRAEMLAEYFVHDGGETQVWRLKGHARGQFWRWVSGWGAMVRKPSDLGHDDAAYQLPDLTVSEHTVAAKPQESGMLFAMEAQTLSERRQARKASLDARVAKCALLVKSEWAKLAETLEDAPNALEARVCEDEAGESESRPRVSEKKKRARDSGSGGKEGVYEGVLQEEPRKVQTNYAGTKSEEECAATGTLREGCRVAQCAQSVGEGVAGIQPIEAESATSKGARNRVERLSGHDGNTKRPLRDMRLLGHEQSEFLSSSRSLPQDGSHSRSALHELQSGPGKIQRRRERANGSGRLSREAWIIWCELNAEQDALEREFGDLAFSVRGPMSPEQKESAILGWLAGERPVMISKPSIMGWGINAQHCARIAFVGVTDSFEAYYQAVRRCWRFGQDREVQVHIFASELEGAVLANLKRKEAKANAMAEALSAETNAAVRAEVLGQERQFNSYNAARRIDVPAWLHAEAS